MTQCSGLTENAGHEIAKHDKYRTKIDYITVQCAFSVLKPHKKTIQSTRSILPHHTYADS